MFSCSIEGPRNFWMMCPEKGSLCAPHPSSRPEKDVYWLAGPWTSEWVDTLPGGHIRFPQNIRKTFQFLSVLTTRATWKHVPCGPMSMTRKDPPPQWPWHTHSSPSLLWQSLLSWHLLCSFYSCSWEVLQDLGSDHLPSLLSIPLSPVFRPNERPPSFNFQKARWDDFASYFDSHCPSAEEYSSLSHSSAAALFTSLALNAAKSSIPFGRIKRPPKAWWSAEVEEAVGERRRAFATAHRSDEDRQAYISASRRASSVIAKAEAWQTTCTFLSPKSNPKSVHSLLRSIAGSPSSSSSSPNFPNCSSPRESALVYAAYLRSHFSVSQPKALRSRARGYLTELHRATCSAECHSSFCSPFSPAEFLAAASNLSSSTATGPYKVAYPMLKHLPRSGMDFLLHIYNLSWSSHSFPSVWKTSSIIPIHNMGKPLDSPASFRPISLTSCVSKLFERIILSVLFSGI